MNEDFFKYIIKYINLSDNWFYFDYLINLRINKQQKWLILVWVWIYLLKSEQYWFYFPIIINNDFI